MNSALTARRVNRRSLIPVFCLAVASLISIAASQESEAAEPAVEESPLEKTAPGVALLDLLESEQNVTNSLGTVLVWLPEGYRVGQHEVTQAEYQKVMGDNPSLFPGERRPVERVSWNQAREFCRKLTEREVKDGALPKEYGYALPTQQQWETFMADANLKDSITSHLGDRRSTEIVGGLGPNKFGLYDVRGNVWEWCSEPVARGGSWRSHEDYLVPDFHFVGSPDRHYDDIGFRVVLQPLSGSGR